MVSIILYKENYKAREKISGLFEFKDNRLYFADYLSDIYSGAVNSPPFKVYLSINDTSELRNLRKICSVHKDVEIIIETAPDIYDDLSSWEDGWASIIKEINKEIQSCNN